MYFPLARRNNGFLKSICLIKSNHGINCLRNFAKSFFRINECAKKYVTCCILHILGGWVGYGVQRDFHEYFSYIVAVSFIGGGNRSTRRKPQSCRSSLTNFII